MGLTESAKQLSNTQQGAIIMSDNVIKTITTDNYDLKVWYDDCAESPRDWDNLGTIVCEHRRYTLGDSQDVDQSIIEMLQVVADGDTDKALNYFETHTYNQCFARIQEKFIVLPVYMYEHSNIALSTGSFIGRAQHAEWDSGQLGFIYVSKEDVRNEYKVSRISKQLLKTVKTVLDNEVKLYGHYINGDCYGYTLDKFNEETQEWENIDSCGGFIGGYWDCGIQDDLPEELRDLL